MGFSRQEYWSGVPLPSPDDTTDKGSISKIYTNSSYNSTAQKQTMLFKNGIKPFCGWVVFHCKYIPHLLYQLICQWAFRLFHVLTVVGSAAINIVVHVSFRTTVLSGVYAQKWQLLIIYLFSSVIISL
jgi:hypothetical protein